MKEVHEKSRYEKILYPAKRAGCHKIILDYGYVAQVIRRGGRR